MFLSAQLTNLAVSVSEGINIKLLWEMGGFILVILYRFRYDVSVNSNFLGCVSNMCGLSHIVLIFNPFC